MIKTLIGNMLTSIVISGISIFLTKIVYASSLDESDKLPEVDFFSGTAADLVFEQDHQSILVTEEVNLINNQSFLIPKTETFKPSITNKNQLIADESSVVENEKQVKSWEFKIQPYYTIPWRVSGEATVDGITVDLDLGLGDLLDALQAYANTRFEAWHGNWGIIVDASYWSFRGISDFQKDLNLNNKIRNRIRDEIDFFLDQEIDKLERLLDREQEIFQAIEETEEALARQLIEQEIERFRQQLINEIKNQPNRKNRLEIFRDLLKAEIQLLEDFDQRIKDEFIKIYDETLMVVEDLQQFRNAISRSDPSPSDFDLSGNLSLDYDQGTYDFALSYHFGEQPVPYNPDENNSSANFPLFWFEPIAGVRLNDFYTGIDADISYGFNGEVLNASGSFRESFVEKRTWFEPMVGAKIGLQVSPPITLWLRGDVSGFGLAGETNLSWNFISGMDWWVSPSTSILLAYRFYEFSYGNGQNLLDINFNGPLIGLTYNF